MFLIMCVCVCVCVCVRVRVRVRARARACVCVVKNCVFTFYIPIKLWLGKKQNTANYHNRTQ